MAARLSRLAVAAATAWAQPARVVLGGDAHGWAWMAAPEALGPVSCGLVDRRRVRARLSLAADLVAAAGVALPSQPAGQASQADHLGGRA